MASEWDEFPLVEPKGDPWAEFPVVEQKPQSAFERAASGAPVVEKERFNTRAAKTGEPAVEKYEEVVAKPGDFNFSAAFKQSLLRDPETQIKVVAHDLFPDDPGATERFGFVNGRLAYVDDDGSLKYAAGKAAEFLGSLLGNAPEIIGGVVGSLAGSPVVGGTAGVAGARGLKDAAAGLIFDEPQTISGNLKDVAVAGASEAAGGLLMKGGLAAVNRGRVVDVTPKNIAQAQAKQASIKATTGVDTDLALASGDKRLLALRNFLAQQPNETAGKIAAADQLAAGQFDDATRQVLDIVAKPLPADVAGGAGINAAQDAIRTARKAVSDRVKPLYDTAYAAAPEITDPKILGMLELPYFSQAMAAGKRIAKLEGTEAAEGVTSLQSLDYLKRGLDDVIEKLGTAGKRQEARALTQRKNEFVKLLDETSGDAYKAARSAYQEGIQQSVEPLENGVVGVLAKIKDNRAATAAAKLFRDENVTAGEILRARKAIEAESPEAWQGLARQYIAKEFNAAKRTTQGGGEVNVPGKLHQRIWGDPAARGRMNAALGKDASEALRGLMETAETLAQAPVKGSNTQPNLAIQTMLEGPGAFWAKALLNPRATVVQGAAKNAVEANSAKLWEALTDPAKVRQLKFAVKIGDPARRAAFITATILGQSTRAVAGPASGSGSPPQ